MNVKRHFVTSVGFFALLALALIAQLMPSAAAADLSGTYTWKPVRIGAGGYMRGMAVHPTNAAVRYARGDVDNIYRWDNTNSVWVPMEVSGCLPASVTNAPASAGGGPIALDPNNAAVVLCGWHLMRSADLQSTTPDVEFSVYRSTNSGASFVGSNLSLPRSPTDVLANDLSGELRGERMMIDPNNSSVVYLGSKASGLWRSMDGGLTWSNVTTNGAPASTANVVLPRFDKGGGTVSFLGQTVSKRIYLTVDSGPVLQSDDGGNSWTNISSGQDVDGRAGFTVVDQNGRLIICNANNGYIDIRTRAGAWSLTQPAIAPAAVTVDSTNANRIFVIGGGGGLCRSLDGGSTWVSLGPAMNYSTTQQIQWLRPSVPVRPNGHFESCSGVYLDPSGKLFVCGGNDGIQMTTPNDSTDSASNPPVWSSVSQGIEEMVGQSVTIPPGGNPVFMVEDESLFTIFNPDAFTAQHHTLDLWTNNTGLSLGQDVAYCPNQPHFVVETSDNGFVPREPLANQLYSGYSSDGGQTWSKFTSIVNGTHPCPLYCGLIAVSPRQPGHQNDAPGNDNIVWAPANTSSQNAPAPFYSTNGGATWQQSQSFNSTAGESQGWRCTQYWTYLGNQCGTWSNLIHQHALESDWLTPGTFYFMCTNLGFWKTTDGGVTWVQQTGTGLPTSMHHVQLRANPNVSGDLWLVDGYEGSVGGHGLYHTTNSGASWTRSSAFDFAWELALGKANGSYPAIYVYGKMTGDANWGVFRSVDGGNTWDRISYLPTGLTDAPASMAASWDVFGQVYISFQGDSLGYGTPTGAPPIPAAPTNLSATAGNTQIALSWIASPGATSFSVYRGTTAGGESSTAIASGLTGYTYTDTGLTNGTTYYYKTTAINSSGTSAYSNEASAVPAPQPPPAPTGVVALSGDTQITVTWSAASTATSYNVYRSTTAGSETLLASGIATTSYTNTGLTNGTTYYYKVAGVNTVNVGPLSSEASNKPSAGNAQIPFTTTAPTIDGVVDSVWSSATSYAMANVTGTIPSGATNTASWQALWDNTNLYLLLSIQDSTVLANNDAVEVYVDGNNGKATAYTSVDWQWVFTNGSSSVQEYSGGSGGSNTSGIVKADGALSGGWRMEAKIPWADVGVSPIGNDVIGLDVAYSNYNVAGTRANKLFWNSTTDSDWQNPSLFGTAKLMAGSGGPPATPTGLTATPGNAQVALSWNLSSGATSYNVKRSTVNGSGYVTVSSPTTTSYTNTGLTNGTTYYYVVSAVNSFGESANSSQVIATPSSGGGGTPVVQISCGGSANGTWIADNYFTGGNTSSTTSAIDTTAVTNPAPQSVYQHNRWANPGTVTYTIPGLTANAAYTVRLHFAETYWTASGQRKFNASIQGTTVLTNFDIFATAGATNKANIQSFSANANASGQMVVAVTDGTADHAMINGIEILTASSGPPATPTGLAATPGNARVALSWNTSTGATSYNVKRSTVNGSGYATITSPTTNSYTNTGLTNGTTYYYVVSAVNSSGESANSSQVIATPVAIPSAPTGLTVTPGNAQVALSWTASSGATSYNVKRSTVNGSGYVTVSSPTGTTYTDTGLTNGTTYYYVVSAVNGSGESANSTQASATPTGGSGGTPVVQISCGGSANGTWIADNYFTGGNTSSTTSAIDTTAVTNPAPQSVYQHNRWANPGTVTYTIPGLTANATYTVRLHFAETYYTATGLRKFNASIQGTQVLTNFDIVAAAGAANKANIQTFSANANASGQMVVAVTDGTADHAMISGIEILTPGGSPPAAPTGLAANPGNAQVALSWNTSTGATSYNVKRSTVNGSGYVTVSSPTTNSYTNTGLTNGTTYYYVVSAVNANGESANSSQVSATPAGATPVVLVNCGGSASGSWVADTYFSGGSTSSTTNAIDTTAVTNPAPQAVYQYNRWGAMTYTITGLTANSQYTVRLHFAETYWTAANQRKFNVAINGTSVLTNFDIFATAGAEFKANVQQFTATANSSGQVVIGFTVGTADQPLISGIELDH
jgi:fibronectin type 3 domain-containing protein